MELSGGTRETSGACQSEKRADLAGVYEIVHEQVKLMGRANYMNAGLVPSAGKWHRGCGVRNHVLQENPLNAARSSRRFPAGAHRLPAFGGQRAIGGGPDARNLRRARRGGGTQLGTRM